MLAMVVMICARCWHGRVAVMRASAGRDRPAKATLRRWWPSQDGKAVKVLWRAKGGCGAARPHLSSISSARKSVVAVAGRRCVPLNVRYVHRDQARQSSKMTRCAGSRAMHYDMIGETPGLTARVWRGCWKLDAKTRSIGSTRRD